MITASHNPKEYNGYKVYGADGAQMSPEDTEKVVGYISKIDDYLPQAGRKTVRSFFPYPKSSTKTISRRCPACACRPKR